MPIGTRAQIGPIHITGKMNTHEPAVGVPKSCMPQTYNDRQQFIVVTCSRQQGTACPCQCVISSRPPIVLVGISKLHTSSTDVLHIPLHHCHIPYTLSPVWSPPPSSRLNMKTCCASPQFHHHPPARPPHHSHTLRSLSQPYNPL